MIQKKRVLDTFLEYIQIDSESTHEKAMAQRLIEDMKAIGCQVYVDQSMDQTGSDTGNLYCTLPATGEGEAIILSAHMDTVTPGRGVEPVIEDGVIRSKGDTILGGDDKSGVVAIVEAMRAASEQNLPHPEIQAIFTVGEEIGLRGSRALEYDKLVAKKAVVLDSSGDVGKIIISAPGQYKLTATVVGRRAHAGVSPEDGISAIQVAAHAISKMKLLRIDEETTANLGTISAKYATNIVPDRVELIGEARSRNDEKLEQQAKHMLSCLEEACQTFGAVLEGGLTRSYTAYTYGKDDPFVVQVSEACKKAGIEPVLAASGGGSDANNMNLKGIQALVLGTGMSKVHTTQEEITVKNLEDTAALVFALITGQA